MGGQKSGHIVIIKRLGNGKNDGRIKKKVVGLRARVSILRVMKCESYRGFGASWG